ISSITATGGISTLGMAFSGLRVILASLLGIPGLILAAFIAAGLLIWRYWEPIKAFFSGLFTGISQGLSPLIQSFSFLVPLFDAISAGVAKVW
ncbi:phage tail tape measure protein, partial [Klebsiella pneumoniae]|nr:phage tail tape measure protein [Klebsiella pneumoniae]